MPESVSPSDRSGLADAEELDAESRRKTLLSEIDRCKREIAESDAKLEALADEEASILGDDPEIELSDSLQREFTERRFQVYVARAKQSNRLSMLERALSSRESEGRTSGSTASAFSAPAGGAARPVATPAKRSASRKNTIRRTRGVVTEVESSGDTALAALRLRRQAQKLEDRKQRTLLRWIIGVAALVMVAVQLVVTNAFFWRYLNANLVDPDPIVLTTWLSSTVVEVVGILWVVARSLFPYRDKSKQSDRAGAKGRE